MWLWVKPEVTACMAICCPQRSYVDKTMDCQEAQSSECRVKHGANGNEFTAWQSCQVSRLCTVSSGFQPEVTRTKQNGAVARGGCPTWYREQVKHTRLLQRANRKRPSKHMMHSEQWLPTQSKVDQTKWGSGSGRLPSTVPQTN